jgi:hypothetical protein
MLTGQQQVAQEQILNDLLAGLPMPPRKSELGQDGEDNV